MQALNYEMNGQAALYPDLHIHETKNTPELIFKTDRCEWTISGKSYPREAEEVYKPMMTWITRIATSPVKSCTINFKYEFYNTITSQVLIQILVFLKELKKSNGLDVKINWFYEEADEDMQENGESMMVASGLFFEMIAVDTL